MGFQAVKTSSPSFYAVPKVLSEGLILLIFAIGIKPVAASSTIFIKSKPFIPSSLA